MDPTTYVDNHPGVHHHYHHHPIMRLVDQHLRRRHNRHDALKNKRIVSAGNIHWIGHFLKSLNCNIYAYSISRQIFLAVTFGIVGNVVNYIRLNNTSSYSGCWSSTVISPVTEAELSSCSLAVSPSFIWTISKKLTVYIAQVLNVPRYQIPDYRKAPGPKCVEDL